MPTTNNKLEGQHKVYTYYPSFKRNMMTLQGAQRVLDYRVFGHNFRKFPAYIKELWAKYKMFRSIIANSPNPSKLADYGMYFKHHFLKVQKWAEKYIGIWKSYFKGK